MNDLYMEQRLKLGSFFSEKNKYIYIETPKAACTFIKTLLLELEGETLLKEDRNQPSRERKSSLLVHDRRLNPMKCIENTAHLERLLDSGDYYVFSVVRHPIPRLFSAWASKIFSHEGDIYFRLRKNPDFPDRVYTEEQDLQKGFESFVRFLSESEFPDFSNHHWQEQHRLLMTDRIPYDDIVKTENLKAFIQGFLKRMHIPEDRIRTRKENVGILAYHQDYISQEALKMIFRMYEKDFDIFGFEKVKPETDKKPLFVKHLADEIIAKNDRIYALLSGFYGEL